MFGFKLWLLRESGEFDREGYNRLFRQQLLELLPRVTDERRRAALEAMGDLNWAGYILTAVRNAGFRDAREQAEKAHDVVVQLLVSPGQLFAGYDPDSSGPMHARFALAVRNGVLNLRRSRSRDHDERAIGIGSEPGEVRGDAIPDRRSEGQDDEVIEAFLTFLRREVGEVAARLLATKLENDLSQRELSRHPEFARLGEWRLRQIMGKIRDAADVFARRHGDEGFQHTIERLVGRPDRRQQARAEWAGWSLPWWFLMAG